MFHGTGNIAGQCTGPSLSFNISGKVSPDGQLSVTLAEPGDAAIFSGKIDKLRQISGTWSAPGKGSGTWGLSL